MVDTAVLAGVVIRGVGEKKTGEKWGGFWGDARIPKSAFGRWQDWTEEEEGISFCCYNCSYSQLAGLQNNDENKRLT